MTTRHTITHADELYAGNAFKGGYSPDGRRGIKMTHLYLHHFLSTASAAPVAADPNGIIDNDVPSDGGYSLSGGNWVSLCTGALVSAGSTAISLDIPRNIVVTVCAATRLLFKIHGRDQYGEAMAETIACTAAGYVSGVRCFKEIDQIYCTMAWGAASSVTIGTGSRLGVPFHLQDKRQVVAVMCDGKVQTSGATGFYTINVGASSATTITTSHGSLDVRGNIQLLNPVPDASKHFSVLMEVDHSTDRAAFGPPQVSSCSNG